MEKNSKIDLVLKKCEKERIKLKHPYVGSEHLFLAILSYKNDLSIYLKEYSVTYDSFKDSLLEIVGNCKKDNPSNLYTPLLRKIIARYNLKNKDRETNIEQNLFLAMLDEGEGIAIRILLKMNIDLDEIYIKLKEKQRISLMQETNKIGVLLNDIVDNDSKVVSREEEINKIILTLTRKKKCNPILIGPAGVGKTALVEELARRINIGMVPDSLKNKKIYLMDMGSLISGTKYRGEFEERLNNIIKEIKNDKNSIIFIDEIHTMIGAGGAEGAINAADILKPYLARGDIKCIGATTTTEYNKSILNDKALQRRFEVISISELNNEDMHNLMISVKKEYEKFHNIKIPKELIDKIIYLSNNYIKNISNPDKTIDLLDTSCAYAKTCGKRYLSEDDIIKSIYYKTNNKLLRNDEILYKVKKELKNYLPDDRLNKLVNLLKIDTDKPKSFITDDRYLIKDFIKSFGDVNIIRIDSENYNNNVNNDTFSKKINESKFYNLIEHPFSIIYFENIDTNDYLIDLIKKINNDGYLEYYGNEKIYFNNAILVALVKESKKIELGFNSTSKSIMFEKSFIESFELDLRCNNKKEIITT